MDESYRGFDITIFHASCPPINIEYLLDGYYFLAVKGQFIMVYGPFISGPNALENAQKFIDTLLNSTSLTW